jgi:hypothetical protein
MADNSQRCHTQHAGFPQALDLLLAPPDDDDDGCAAGLFAAGLGAGLGTNSPNIWLSLRVMLTYFVD